MAALVEEYHDKDGIRWPRSVAPYDATVLLLDAEPELVSLAEGLVADLEAAGFEPFTRRY